VRLWRFDGRGLRPAAGGDPGWTPPVPLVAGLVPTPTGSVQLDPVPGIEGYWVETPAAGDGSSGDAAERVKPVLAALLDAERQRALLAEELATRYEEIDLLYAISEILGRTTRLDQAAQTIVREVSTVVGARRASIMVYDEATGLLRTVAARGFSTEAVAPVSPDDDHSVAARVFRERRVLVRDPDEAADAPEPTPGEPSGLAYNSRAYLSVPISYAAPGGTTRCLGVINLTERIGEDRFTPGDRKLVTAVANQIGAAVENARLVQRDLRQQRLRRELELAHDLQLKLLPHPGVLQDEARLAARCVPAESVGGDFYTFTRLGRGRIGVMLGDVSSHGFSAALIMALVMSAAGIHAAAAVTPDETLSALLESLGTELSTTEMYFTVFYGVLDPVGRRLSYANAGHPYAFRIPAVGDAERLTATGPPIGLASQGTIDRRQIAWAPEDLLCLSTDGLVDARNSKGERFGERRLLDLVSAHRAEAPEAILQAVYAEADAFTSPPVDDRTLLVLRLNPGK